MRRELKKPNFEPLIGMWINPDFLSPEVRKTLHDFAIDRGKASEKQASALVVAASEWAHVQFEQGVPAAPDAIRSSLATVADRAHDLLHSLSALHPSAASAFHAHWDALLFLTHPPKQLSELSSGLRGEEGRFLGALWELVHDLRDAADYASEHVKPDRSHKPAQGVARSLVRSIAWSHNAIFSALPKTYKGHWFPDFCAVVGEAMPQKLKVGRALVEGVVTSMHAPPG